ncbi:uncharacterized protein LOC107267859 [Cephus cinctus]|uniref:Uncharacterized protein LOC107267859 n=1 Tax=Cephus cinctus TaxID=211228 RepID=A0AAJ7BVR8_CEPCN|nr:uncharacterized protein LOC107267859 [Cephus cinctus]
MGIVSSTFASLAIQFAWNCQRLLDPQYSCVEGKKNSDLSPASLSAPLSSSRPVMTKTSSLSKPENNNSAHQENRNRRAVQTKHRRRPSSFDTALIANRAENCVSLHGNGFATTFSPPRRQRIHAWDITSSSGCSSDSSSDLDSDSDGDFRLHEFYPEDNCDERQSDEAFTITPAEQVAFRLTVGRGYFSRSKKDRFLNHLRLEKRLNDLSNPFFEMSYRGHGRALQRRHSGDLYRIV